jgi:hypothetical protein
MHVDSGGCCFKPPVMAAAPLEMALTFGNRQPQRNDGLHIDYSEVGLFPLCRC